MAQVRSSVTERRSPLTNGRANEAKERVTSAEKNVSGVEQGMWCRGRLPHAGGGGVIIDSKEDAFEKKKVTDT